MGWTRPALVFIALLTRMDVAAAQTPPDPMRCGGGREVRLDGEKPFAGATIRYSLIFDCADIVLYRLTPRLVPREITAEQRRAHVRDERPYTGAPHFYARVLRIPGPTKNPPPPLMWADQATCPALLPAIEALSRAMTPNFTGDGPVRGGIGYFTVDGAGVNVWAAGQMYPLNNSSHRFRIDYDTNLGTPTANWVEATLAELKPCLTTTEPVPEPPIP